MDIQEKKCSRCEQVKQLSEFAPRKEGRLGRMSQCHECCREAIRLYRIKNPYTPKPKRAKKSEAELKAISKQYSKAYYERNKKRKNELAKLWKQANPEKLADYNHVRRARKYKVAYERIDALVVANRDNWICQICFEPIDSSLTYPNQLYRSVDHIIPLSKGGTHVYENVQIAHLRCNTIKATN